MYSVTRPSEATAMHRTPSSLRSSTHPSPSAASSLSVASIGATNPVTQIQLRRLKITYSVSDTASMSASANGYPAFHPSSGMCSKFMP